MKHYGHLYDDRRADRMERRFERRETRYQYGHSGGWDDWLDWLIQTVVKVAVGVSVGLILGIVYLIKALLPDAAAAKVEARVEQVSGGPPERDTPFQTAPDLHQARNRAKVDTRINKPKEPADTRTAPVFRKRPKVNTGWFRTIFGVFWSFMGLTGLGAQADALWMFLIFLVPGCWCLYSGITSRRNNRRYAGHLNRIGDRETISREELAAIVGCTAEQAEKDLRKMAASGYLGNAAYYNDQYERLFLNHEAERAWLGERREEEARSAPPPREAEEGYSGILRRIRRTNDAIKDPVLSAKVDQLADITARIFKEVEEHPEKEKQITTLLDYYLPTTQKLLDSYVQFESAGVEGENVSQSKARISETMDMILNGFSHQLDELYRGDAMDVDSDIRVMETMLRRDAGTVADDFGFGGSAFQQMPKDQ